jgi:hypothetical protein
MARGSGPASSPVLSSADTTEARRPRLRREFLPFVIDPLTHV